MLVMFDNMLIFNKNGFGFFVDGKIDVLIDVFEK